MDGFGASMYTQKNIERTNLQRGSPSTQRTAPPPRPAFSLRPSLIRCLAAYGFQVDKKNDAHIYRATGLQGRDSYYCSRLQTANDVHYRILAPDRLQQKDAQSFAGCYLKVRPNGEGSVSSARKFPPTHFLCPPTIATLVVCLCAFSCVIIGSIL